MENSTNQNNNNNNNPVNHEKSSGSNYVIAEKKVSLYQIIAGLFLIFVQFFMNHSFLGTGYSKWYFNIIIIVYTILIITTLTRDLIKLFFFASFIAILLNQFNVFIYLASKTAFGLINPDYMVVGYYVLAIILIAIVRLTVLRDQDPAVSEYTLAALLSIIIPLLLIKFPFSNFFVSSDSFNLIKLFFSVPFLWQPFFIMGIFKAKYHGSIAAKIFAFFWLVLILFIIFVSSYVSVPADARTNLKMSGSNVIVQAGDAICQTKNLLKEKLINPIQYGFDSNNYLETQIDSDQTTNQKGIFFNTIDLSEGPEIYFGENTVDELSAWSGVSINLGSASIDGLSAKFSCEAIMGAYTGFFKDVTVDKEYISGTINDQKVYTEELSKLNNGETLTCIIKKDDFLNKLKKPTDISSTSLSLVFESSYDFFSAGYLTRFFIDSDLYNSFEGKTSSEILSELYNIDATKYSTSKYTSGPISIAISAYGAFNKNSVLIPISSDKNFNIDFQLSLSGDSSSQKIDSINWLYLAIPKEFVLKKCTPIEFKEISYSDLDENIKKYLPNMDAYNYYKLSDDDKIKSFFNMDQNSPSKRFSCSMNIDKDLNGAILKSDVNLFVNYVVETKKTKVNLLGKYE